MVRLLVNTSSLANETPSEHSFDEGGALSRWNARVIRSSSHVLSSLVDLGATSGEKVHAITAHYSTTAEGSSLGILLALASLLVVVPLCIAFVVCRGSKKSGASSPTSFPDCHAANASDLRAKAENKGHAANAESNDVASSPLPQPRPSSVLDSPRLSIPQAARTVGVTVVATAAADSAGGPELVQIQTTDALPEDSSSQSYRDSFSNPNNIGTAAAHETGTQRYRDSFSAQSSAGAAVAHETSAQRYRDSVSAQSSTAAVAKHGTSNQHVRDSFSNQSSTGTVATHDTMSGQRSNFRDTETVATPEDEQNFRGAGGELRRKMKKRTAGTEILEQIATIRKGTDDFLEQESSEHLKGARASLKDKLRPKLTKAKTGEIDADDTRDRAFSRDSGGT